MSKNTSQTADTFEFKAEMRQLLDLIVNSLYTHPEIFLRELISNSSDALNKARYRGLTDKDMRDADAPLQIKIEIDKDAKKLVIEDSGIGMRREDLINRLGTVASSGTLEFIKNLKDAGEQKVGDMIGQFGVGFYSVFMVAEEVTVETLHADADATAWRWVSDGKGSFTLEEIEREHRGTRISFTLKDSADEFADDYRVKSIIKKYSNFVEFPIMVGDEKVNSVRALWHESKDSVSEEEYSEFYKFVTNDFSGPLGHLHLSIEGASVNFKALLFIPENSHYRTMGWQNEKTAQLYSNKVFIMDDCKDLLPEYLHFVKGVVDTEDLPLNVSREMTQNSPVMARIKQILTKRLLSLLEEWAEKEPEKYAKFYEAFGSPFVMGVNMDFDNRERLIKLLRFHSTTTEGEQRTGFADYVARKKDDQKDIYYFTGDHRDSMQNSPKLEYFRKNEIEVMLLTDPADVMVIPSIDKFEEYNVVSIEKADLEIKEDESTDAEKEQRISDEQADSLLASFKAILGEQVEDVRISKRLVDSAATLVAGAQGMDAHMERMMKMMDASYGGSKKILEINPGHDLIKNLARIQLGGGSDEDLRPYIMQLFEGAMLLDGALSGPTDFVQRMTKIMTDATQK